MLVELAVRFGPWDYFALMVLAFVTVSATFGDSVVRGLTSLALGLVLGLVDMDKLTGQARLAFGVPTLLDGISITTLAVGLFAIGETLFVVSRFTGVAERIEAVRGLSWMTLDDWRRSWKPWLRGIGLGFPIGALPAGGAEVPTLLSYTIERKLARPPSRFGHGAIEGVARPEAANNAAATGTLVPLLALGMPTSAAAAMLLADQFGAFDGHRIRGNADRGGALSGPGQYPGRGPDGYMAVCGHHAIQGCTAPRSCSAGQAAQAVLTGRSVRFARHDGDDDPLVARQRR